MASTSAPELLEDAVDSLDELLFIISPSGEYIQWNDQFTTTTGYTDDEIEELEPGDIVFGNEREGTIEAIETVVNQESTETVESVLETKAGEQIPYELTISPLAADDGELRAITIVGRNITDRKRQMEIQQSMAEALADVSVPIVEVWDGVLLSTIIGTLDSAQAEDFTEDLLNQIDETGSSVAIIDITGAEAVDTQTAQHLIDTIHAVRLMGGETIITGLSPAISQTLVQLGIGFDVETRSSLEDGLKSALEIVGASFD